MAGLSIAPMSRAAKSVSLVLGSGGARGLAHIGVIEWLTQNGYEIRSIAGSSMGALVGGIYAARKLDLYAQWVSALERAHVIRLLDPGLRRNGLFKGERIIGVLRELIGEHEIAELPLSFTAVATDLDSGEEVWLREGRLFDAIRASMATPLVFTPFVHGGRTLLDGALVNPLPVAPTLGDGTDLTIAVSLGGAAEPQTAPPPPRSGGRGLLDVAWMSMQTMLDTIARLKLAAHTPDVTIEIPRNACGYHEFWRAEELIALGRERAAQALAGAGLASAQNLV
jgi:NTE family protein